MPLPSRTHCGSERDADADAAGGDAVAHRCLRGGDIIRHLEPGGTRQNTESSISAGASREDREKAANAGATDFLPKAFRASQLIGLLERHPGIRFMTR